MKKELLALSRDLHGLAALFLMPVLFIVIMSVALKDVYNPPVQSISYVVEDNDGSELSHALLTQWEKRHGKPRQGVENWHDAVRSGKLGYALIIEPGFSVALYEENLEGQDIQLRLLADPGIEGGAFAATKAELLMLATGLRSEVLITNMKHEPITGESAANLSAQPIVQAERL